MKWLVRFLYIFLVFLVGFYILNYSNMKKRFDFFVDNTEDLIENYDREEFMKYFMTASNVKDYLNKPLYLANDENNKVEFSLYHGKYVAKKGEGDLLFFSFRDINANIENMLADKEKYTKDNFTATIKIEVFMDEDTKPIVESFQINKRAQMPISLIEIVEKDGANKFRYIVTDDAGKAVEKYADNISKIELTLVDLTTVEEADDKPIETKLLVINNNLDANNDNDDTLLLNNNIYESNNFNGNINNYLYSDKYNDETVGILVFDELDKYSFVVRNNLIKFGVVIAILTYLLFFLRPTIKFIQNKELFRKKERLSLESNSNDNEIEVIETKEDKE